MGSMHKSVKHLVCAGLLLLLIFPTGLALAGGGVPGVIYMKTGPRVDPLWVSAKAAASETGDVRWELFSSSDQDHLRRFLADSERLRREAKSSQGDQAGGKSGVDLECPLRLVSEEGRMEPKPNRSLSDLTEQALAIYSGRIEGISQGFFSGVPSSLLQVKVVKAFRSSDLVASEEVLIPYSFAHFRIGTSAFCGGRYGMLEPAVGDRVLVFIYDSPVNADRTLVSPQSPELFFQTSAGHLVVPRELKTDKVLAVTRSLDELEKLLRYQLKEKRPESGRSSSSGSRDAQ